MSKACEWSSTLFVVVGDNLQMMRRVSTRKARVFLESSWKTSCSILNSYRFGTVQKKKEYIWYCCHKASKTMASSAIPASDEMEEDLDHQEKEPESKLAQDEDKVSRFCKYTENWSKNLHKMTQKKLLDDPKGGQDDARDWSKVDAQEVHKQKLESKFADITSHIDSLKKAAAHDTHSRRHARKARNRTRMLTHAASRSFEAESTLALSLQIPSGNESPEKLDTPLPDVHFGTIASSDGGQGFISCKAIDAIYGQDVLFLQKHVIGGLSFQDGDKVSFLVVPPSKACHHGYPQARQVCHRSPPQKRGTPPQEPSHCR